MLNSQYLVGDNNYGVEFYLKPSHFLGSNQRKTSFYWQYVGLFLDPRS